MPFVQDLLNLFNGGPPQAVSRIGRTPIRFGNGTGPNLGSQNPLTGEIYLRDRGDSESLRHEDVHSVLSNSGLLGGVSLDDFKQYENLAMADDRTFMDKLKVKLLPTKTMEEIIAEGIARGGPRAQDIISKLSKQPLDDEKQATIAKLQRLARMTGKVQSPQDSTVIASLMNK